jgi:hypothetical protein
MTCLHPGLTTPKPAPLVSGPTPIWHADTSVKKRATADLPFPQVGHGGGISAGSSCTSRGTALDGTRYFYTTRNTDLYNAVVANQRSLATQQHVGRTTPMTAPMRSSCRELLHRLLGHLHWRSEESEVRALRNLDENSLRELGLHPGPGERLDRPFQME